MKLSIITVVLNNGKYIEECMNSVLSQTYPDTEYVVVDGGSTDGTMDVIGKYNSSISKWVSEPDHGLYDAMNKGIALSSGEVVGFLNADDCYAHERVLETVAAHMTADAIDSCYGDLVYVDREAPGRVIRYWKSCAYEESLFRKGWMPPHPTFFVRRSVYEEHGLFNPAFGSAADYELMLRLLEMQKITTAYIAEILVKMRSGGVSNRSIRNRVAASRMDRAAWIRNGLTPPTFLWLLKSTLKLGQWFERPANESY